MELKLNKPSFDQLKVGDVFSFRRRITKEDILAFAKLTGDTNPLHVEKGVVHGMFLGGLLSALVGMLCPGEKSLYLSQTLNFRKPVNAGEEVSVEGEVANLSVSAKIVEMQVKITGSDGAVAADGVAKAKFRDDA